MTAPLISAPAPIAYDLEGAAAAVGRTKRTIQRAIAKGDITPRFPDSRPIIGHAELLAWFNSLPLDRPSA